VDVSTAAASGRRVALAGGRIARERTGAVSFTRNRGIGRYLDVPNASSSGRKRYLFTRSFGDVKELTLLEQLLADGDCSTGGRPYIA